MKLPIRRELIKSRGIAIHQYLNSFKNANFNESLTIEVGIEVLSLKIVNKYIIGKISPGVIFFARVLEQNFFFIITCFHFRHPDYPLPTSFFCGPKALPGG